MTRAIVLIINTLEGGLGLELGTQISGNGGPVKFIAFWSRDFYINEYYQSITTITSNYGTFSTIEDNLLQEKIGVILRFGRYSPLNNFRLRGINYDFRIGLHNISNEKIFDFERDYLESMKDWHLGFGFQFWVHRICKIVLDVGTDSSPMEFLNNISSTQINNVRIGFSYSFDSFR